MSNATKTLEDAELVSCTHCGAVFDLEAAQDHHRCPVCDMKGEIATIPRYGNVRKWWREV